MSIDPKKEKLITLREALAHFPSHREGKAPHISRAYRYTKQGCRGVVLESIQCGAKRCTSIEAIHRFFERLTAEVPSAPPRQDDYKSERAKQVGLRLEDTYFSTRRHRRSSSSA